MSLKSFYNNIKKLSDEKRQFRCVQPVNREEGAQGAIKSYIQDTAVNSTNFDEKNLGVRKAAKKYDAQPSKKIDTYVDDEREPGSTAALKHLNKFGVLQSFKKEIRNTLGLPLDSSLNKGNKGL